jgi:hypothetical protein
MLRVLLTIVLPLLLPTAVYVGWLYAERWSRRDAEVRWAALPWLWLAGGGVLLLALVLFVVTVHFGTPQSGTYVPTRWENGRVVPGHIEPGP